MKVQCDEHPRIGRHYTLMSDDDKLLLEVVKDTDGKVHLDYRGIRTFLPAEFGEWLEMRLRAQYRLMWLRRDVGYTNPIEEDVYVPPADTLYEKLLVRSKELKDKCAEDNEKVYRRHSDAGHDGYDG